MSNSEDSHFSISLGAALAHGCCGGHVRRVSPPAASATIVTLPVLALPSEGVGNPAGRVPSSASVDTLTHVDLHCDAAANSPPGGRVTTHETSGEPR